MLERCLSWLFLDFCVTSSCSEQIELFDAIGKLVMAALLWVGHGRPKCNFAQFPHGKRSIPQDPTTSHRIPQVQQDAMKA